MTLRIAVLGCGPTGLAAVHAISRATHNKALIHIFSKKRKSHLYGAQYLHQPIPGLGIVPTTHVDYILEGTADGYREKVYGDAYVPQVSVEHLTGKAPAWDIRESYNRLWGMYSEYVTDCVVTPLGLDNMLNQQSYDLIVNTVPLDSLCKGGHHFSSQTIWAKGDTYPQETGTDCRVICNGEKNPAWYRYSEIFGFSTTEWPEQSKPPIPGVVEWRKPLTHNCDCWPWEETKMLRVGRYGAWKKGILVHHAYELVNGAVRLMEAGPLAADPNNWEILL